MDTGSQAVKAKFHYTDLWECGKYDKSTEWSTT